MPTNLLTLEELNRPGTAAKKRGHGQPKPMSISQRHREEAIHKLFCTYVAEYILEDDYDEVYAMATIKLFEKKIASRFSSNSDIYFDIVDKKCASMMLQKTVFKQQEEQIKILTKKLSKTWDHEIDNLI